MFLKGCPGFFRCFFGLTIFFIPFGKHLHNIKQKICICFLICGGFNILPKNLFQFLR